MATASSTTATRNDSAPSVVDKVLQQMLQDDQEEWEYEYSTIETEVGVDASRGDRTRLN